MVVFGGMVARDQKSWDARLGGTKRDGCGTHPVQHDHPGLMASGNDSGIQCPERRIHTRLVPSDPNPARSSWRPRESDYSVVPENWNTVGSTICGHLPKIVARRVRSRLPPPPPSPAGARTPGALRGNPRFFPGISGDFGWVRARNCAGETRPGEAVRRVPGIVSRACFRGPGLSCTVWGNSLAEWPVCARASRHPGYPGKFRIKNFDRAHGPASRLLTYPLAAGQPSTSFQKLRLRPCASRKCSTYP